jgi:hypothetical protein
MDVRGCPRVVKHAEREVPEGPQAHTGQAGNARQVGTGELDRSRDARKRQEDGHFFPPASAAHPDQPAGPPPPPTAGEVSFGKS